MTPTSSPEFPGFPDFRANVTFVPIQFFTVVLPHRSRSCARLVGFIIRRLLGWVDTEGNPTHEQIEFNYSELGNEAGLSRDRIAEALTEAQKHHLIECVRPPYPDGPGRSAQKGVYRLRWGDHYTDSPLGFAGFFRQEAVAVSEIGQSVAEAKSARKNVPNAFFDYVLRRERLSVVRVVGLMLFRSIQWGPGGERKVPVTMSVSEVCRLTRMTRRHAHQAVQEALARGYIQCVQTGYFDPKAGQQSRAATYRIRWTSQPVNPVHLPPRIEVTSVANGVSDPYPFSDRSEKGYGKRRRKGKRHPVEKGNGYRSEKGNGISIKRSIKNRTTAAVGSPAPVAAAAGGVLAKLLGIGFDATTAGHLANCFPAEVIEHQLAWLPQRKVDTNQLGLLRRAIEGNWPQPEASALAPEHATGALFVRHFEAALHRHTEPPSACKAKEAELATGFLRELAATGAHETSASEWGKRFGQFVRRKSPPKPWFIWALRVYGSEFMRECRQAVHRDEKASAVEGRRTHEERFTPSYLEYLSAHEAGLRCDDPALYAAFEAHREELHAQFQLSPKTRELLASEMSRLYAFVEFLRERGVRVLDFWAWDRQFNAQRWQDVHSFRQRL